MAEAACSFTASCTSELANCSVGILMNEEVDCHTVSKHVSSKGLINITELSTEKLELIRWRTGLQEADLETICLHHENKFFTIFESSQWKCCDPFKLHKKAARSSLRPISMSSAMQFNQSGILVKPGEKLCTMCRKRCPNDEELQDIHEDDFVPSYAHKEILDSSITELGCSPIKTCGVGDRASYGKRKLNTITQVISDKVVKVLEIPGGAEVLLGIEKPVERTVKIVVISDC